MAVPQRLETDRLLLRRHSRSDARPIARLLNNWNIVRWLAQVPFPYSERDANEWIHQTGRSWANGSEYQFVVVVKDSGEMIGHVGLRVDAARRDGELGYWLGELYWGRGYGSEAARAAVAFGFTHLGLERIWATALPDNDRSLKVLRKAGLEVEAWKLQEFATLSEVVEVPLLSISRDDFFATAEAG